MAHPLNRPDGERNDHSASIFDAEPVSATSTNRVNNTTTTDPGAAAVPTDHREPTTIDSTATVPDRATVVARQNERFGGIKAGSAFFGWLTATGMSVLLIALLAAAGVVFGVATNTSVSVDQAVQESANATGTAQTVGLVGAITLLVVLLVAYYCGRADGPVQWREAGTGGVVVGGCHGPGRGRGRGDCRRPVRRVRPVEPAPSAGE
jgi:hypothetical protein